MNVDPEERQHDLGRQLSCWIRRSREPQNPSGYTTVLETEPRASPAHVLPTQRALRRIANYCCCYIYTQGYLHTTEDDGRHCVLYVRVWTFADHVIAHQARIAGDSKQACSYDVTLSPPPLDQPDSFCYYLTFSPHSCLSGTGLDGEASRLAQSPSLAVMTSAPERMARGKSYKHHARPP